MKIAPISGDLDELVNQSVSERRPFRGKSQGFRDALIWRSVLELADKDEVLFITRNWRDFAQDDKHQDALHPHLREDLAAAGHRPDRVRLVPSLEECIQANVPSAEELAQARKLLEADSGWRMHLTEKVHEALSALDLGWSDDVTVVTTRTAEIDDIAVAEVELGNIAIDDAYETDEAGLASVEVRAHATLRFSFTTDDIGAEWLSDEGADVELDRAAETHFQGKTFGRDVVAIFTADFDPSTGDLGELEKISVTDANNEVGLPPARP